MEGGSFAVQIHEFPLIRRTNCEIVQIHKVILWCSVVNVIPVFNGNTFISLVSPRPFHPSLDNAIPAPHMILFRLNS